MSLHGHNFRSTRIDGRHLIRTASASIPAETRDMATTQEQSDCSSARGTDQFVVQRGSPPPRACRICMRKQPFKAVGGERMSCRGLDSAACSRRPADYSFVPVDVDGRSLRRRTCSGIRVGVGESVYDVGTRRTNSGSMRENSIKDSAGRRHLSGGVGIYCTGVWLVNSYDSMSQYRRVSTTRCPFRWPSEICIYFVFQPCRGSVSRSPLSLYAAFILTIATLTVICSSCQAFLRVRRGRAARMVYVSSLRSIASRAHRRNASQRM